MSQRGRSFAAKPTICSIRRLAHASKGQPRQELARFLPILPTTQNHTRRKNLGTCNDSSTAARKYTPFLHKPQTMQFGNCRLAGDCARSSHAGAVTSSVRKRAGADVSPCSQLAMRLSHRCKARGCPGLVPRLSRWTRRIEFFRSPARVRPPQVLSAHSLPERLLRILRR